MNTGPISKWSEGVILIRSLLLFPFLKLIQFLNWKQEGLRLVGFKYQKADDCLDSKFHCSYLESRGVPKKNREIRKKTTGNYLPFTSCSRLPVPVMQLPVTSFPVTLEDHCLSYHPFSVAILPYVLLGYI
jgi:hypothetical protein